MKKENKHYFFIKGSKKVYLEENIFREFRKLVDHIHYDNKKQRSVPWVNYSKEDEEEYGYFIENCVADPSFDYTDFYIKHELKQALYAAINSLSEDEQRIIFYIFFKGYTLAKVATLEKTYTMKIMRKRDKTLLKLRTMLADYSSYIEE